MRYSPMALSALLLLVACSDDSGSNSTPTDSSTSQDVAEEETGDSTDEVGTDSSDAAGAEVDMASQPDAEVDAVEVDTAEADAEADAESDADTAEEVHAGLRRYEVDSEEYPSALCNDGSTPVYYYRAGRGDGVDRWLIWLEGDGVCASTEQCAERAENDEARMSSDGLEEDAIALGGIFTFDAEENPDFYDWNHVALMACSSDAWLGDAVDAPFDDLLFRGGRIMAAVVDSFDLDGAEFVLLAGSRSGGWGALNHADRLAEHLDGPPVLVVADGATSPIVTPIAERDMSEFLSLASAAWSPTLDESCAEDRGEAGHRCLLGDELVTGEHVDSNLFVQLDLDSEFARTINGVDVEAPDQATVARIRARVESALTDHADGAFGPRQGGRDLLTQEAFFGAGDTLVDGLSMAEVLANWVYDRDGTQSAVTPADDELTPPETTIDSRPDELELVAEARFEFSCNLADCGFECSLDEGAAEECTSPFNVTGLTDDEHTFSVTAVDYFGQRDATPAAVTWAVDANGPNVDLTPPPALHNLETSTFEWTCDEVCTAFCRLGDGEPEECESPSSYTGLDDGDYRFEIYGVDEHGHRTEPIVGFDFELDTTSPGTTIDSGPGEGETLDSAVVTFEFSCDDPPCTFNCRLDRTGLSPTEACDGGSFSADDLPSDEDYIFKVQATDAAGNVEEEVQTRTFDFTSKRPFLDIRGHVYATQNDFLALDVTCTVEPCDLECRFDGADWASCPSNSDTGDEIYYSGLDQRMHSLIVRGVSGEFVGREYDFEWLVDWTPPDPPELSWESDDFASSDSPTVLISCDEADSQDCVYDCDLDGLIVGVCRSPARLSVWNGDHYFSVRTRDRAGNQSEPARLEWTASGLRRTYVELSAGSQNTCSIDDQRVLRCWGDNRVAQVLPGGDTIQPLPVARDEEGWHSVAVGKQTFCGILDAESDGDGGLYCAQMHTGSLQQQRDRTDYVFVDVNADGDTPCAITQSGEERRLHCGLGAVSHREVPGGFADWLTASVGNNLGYCGIREGEVSGQGSLYCGGFNNGAAAPTPIGEDSTWTDVGIGSAHTCALNAAGELYCYGDNASGQVGVDPEVQEDVDTMTQVQPGSGRFIDMDVAGDLSCGIYAEDDVERLYCWGDNSGLQLGMTDALFTHVPQRIGDLENVETVTVGSGHVCVGVGGDSLYHACWGSDHRGKLGRGTSRHYLEADAISPVTGWREVALTDNSGCGIHTDGTLWCWGEEAYTGQPLGYPVQPVPRQVGDADDWIHLSTVGNSTIFGIRDAEADGDGRLYGWGGNGGVLGGRESVIYTPTAYDDNDDWVVVSGGGSNACGIREGAGGWRRLDCWGSNTTNVLGPQRAAGIAINDTNQTAGDWLDVATGDYNACGIREVSDGRGTMWCWGRYWYLFGEASAGDPVVYPVQVGDADDWTRVEMGDQHACGFRYDEGVESMWCWGRGDSGQLGRGSLEHSGVPAAVDPPEGTHWVNASLTQGVTCAVTNQSQLFCFGSNSSGHLLNGEKAPVSQSTPLAEAAGHTNRVDVALRDHGGCVVTGHEPAQLHCWGSTNRPTTADDNVATTEPFVLE